MLLKASPREEFRTCSENSEVALNTIKFYLEYLQVNV